MRPINILLIILLGLGVWHGGVAQYAPTSHAGTLIVVDGTCTLPDAITAANTDTATGNCAAGDGADNIRLDVDVLLTTYDPASTFDFSAYTALPTITSTITLEAGAGTIISGNNTGFRLLHIAQAGHLTLNGLTLQNTHLQSAFTTAAGGAILNRGTLILTNVTVQNIAITSRTDVAHGGAL